MAHPIGKNPAHFNPGDIRPSDLPDPQCLPAEIDPMARELLDRAARTIRLRPESTRILLQWKTARRLRNTTTRRAA
jgi:hypothetical protein